MSLAIEAPSTVSVAMTQIRTVLERYRQADGDVRIELLEGYGPFPPIDAAERWNALSFEFIDSAS